MTQKLVLIGGGHSHAIVLKQWGIQPLPGVELTLITDVVYTPYSGMLPGYIAGFYDYHQCHINLTDLCQLSQVKMITDRAIHLDLSHQQVLCENHPPIPFDLLSIDIGSTPSLASIPGAKQYAIPVKPIPQFLTAWDEILKQQEMNPKTPLKIAIVGGGAGGVELALNMQTRLYKIVDKITKEPSKMIELHLFHREQELLTNHNSWVRQRLHKMMIERSIQLHLQETVMGIESPSNQLLIHCESGLNQTVNYIFLVTEATPIPWLKESGIMTDEKGFILVNDYLQSLSHPTVFAAGDVATMSNHPRPKAGVFAVRQGLPLYHNLRRFLQQEKLQKFIPQKQYLSLISTGDKRAIASRSFWGWYSALMWDWKDHIDRRFMSQFMRE